jgi:hypothetical protein
VRCFTKKGEFSVGSGPKNEYADYFMECLLISKDDLVSASPLKSVSRNLPYTVNVGKQTSKLQCTAAFGTVYNMD